MTVSETQADDVVVFARAMEIFRDRCTVDPARAGKIGATQKALAALAKVSLGTLSMMENLDKAWSDSTSETRFPSALEVAKVVLAMRNVHSKEFWGLMKFFPVSDDELANSALISLVEDMAGPDEPGPEGRDDPGLRQWFMQRLLAILAPDGVIRASSMVFTANETGTQAADSELRRQELRSAGRVRTWTTSPTSLVLNERFRHLANSPSWPSDAVRTYNARCGAFNAKADGEGWLALISKSGVRDYVSARGASQVSPRGPWELNLEQRREHVREVIRRIGIHSSFRVRLVEEQPPLDIHISGASAVMLRPGFRLLGQGQSVRSRYDYIWGIGSVGFAEQREFAVILKCLADFEAAWELASDDGKTELEEILARADEGLE